MLQREKYRVERKTETHGERHKLKCNILQWKETTEETTSS